MDSNGQKYINLLILSTITRGIELKHNTIKFNCNISNMLPAIDEQLEQRWLILSGQKLIVNCEQTSIYLPPLEPDPLGERFVLLESGYNDEFSIATLQKHVRINRFKKLWETGEEENKKGMLAFLALLVNDYPEEADKLGLINENILKNDSEYLDEAYVIMQAISKYSLNDNLVCKTDNLIKKLECIYNLKPEDNNLELLTSAAMFNKGIGLENLNHFKDAIDIYDHFIEVFGLSKNIDVQEIFIQVLISKGRCLVNDMSDKSLKDAIAIFDRVITEYESSTSPKIQSQVAEAMVNKGLTLGYLKYLEKAIATFNNMIDRFISSSLPVEHQVVTAMFSKGVCYTELGNIKSAVVVYKQVINIFGKSKDSDVQKVVSMAIYNKEHIIEIKEYYAALGCGRIGIDGE